MGKRNNQSTNAFTVFPNIPKTQNCISLWTEKTKHSRGKTLILPFMLLQAEKSLFWGCGSESCMLSN
jgi:hypothetical protein